MKMKYLKNVWGLVNLRRGVGAMLMTNNVFAATLDSLWQEMISIILTNSTARQSAIEQVRLARDASSFSASIVFGYAEKASSDTPKGIDKY